jgi:type VI protein secretion system component VasF
MVPSRRRATPPPERYGSRTLRIGKPHHFRWLRGIVWAMLVLNLADAVLTLVWVRHEMAEESNPLLAELVHKQPVLFLLVKMGLVGFGSTLLWRFRKRRLAVISIFVCFLVYYFVLLYHIRSLKEALEGVL